MHNFMVFLFTSYYFTYIFPELLKLFHKYNFNGDIIFFNDYSVIYINCFLFTTTTNSAGNISAYKSCLGFV